MIIPQNVEICFSHKSNCNIKPSIFNIVFYSFKNHQNLLKIKQTDNVSLETPIEYILLTHVHWQFENYSFLQFILMNNFTMTMWLFSGISGTQVNELGHFIWVQ